MSSVTLFDDLGVYQVLATAQNSASLERFVHEWLGTLMDYDATHGAQLVHDPERVPGVRR